MELIRYRQPWLDISRKGWDANSSLILENVLESFAGNSCSDPRDKVYGLLNLVAEVERFPSIGWFDVDYSKTVDEVYFDIFGALRKRGTERIRYEKLKKFMQEQMGINSTTAEEIATRVEKTVRPLFEDDWERFVAIEYPYLARDGDDMASDVQKSLSTITLRPFFISRLAERSTLHIFHSTTTMAALPSFFQSGSKA